jgi:hypothetical protein
MHRIGPAKRLLIILVAITLWVWFGPLIFPWQGSGSPDMAESPGMIVVLILLAAGGLSWVVSRNPTAAEERTSTPGPVTTRSGAQRRDVPTAVGRTDASRGTFRGSRTSADSHGKRSSAQSAAAVSRQRGRAARTG